MTSTGSHQSPLHILATPSLYFLAHRKNEALVEPFATCSSGLSLESYACRCCRRRMRGPLCAIPLHKDHKCNAKCHTLLSCIMTCALATRSRGRMSALCTRKMSYKGHLIRATLLTTKCLIKLWQSYANKVHFILADRDSSLSLSNMRTFRGHLRGYN